MKVMKALPFFGWIVIGVLLGLVIGRVFGPKSKRITHAPRALVPLRPSLLAQENLTGSLYAALPELRSLSVESAAEQLRSAHSAKSPARRRAELKRLLVGLAADPEKAADLVRRLQENATATNDHVRIISDIFAQWAVKDPRGAMDALTTLKTHQIARGAMRSALKTWVRSDPENALSFVKNATLDIVATHGPRLALNALAEIDPQKAFDASRQFDDENLERSLHRLMIARKAEINMEQTWAELGRLDDEKLQADLRDAAIGGLANKDRNAALVYIEKLTNPDKRAYHVRSIFRDWPLSNAEEAKEAFLRHPGEALVDGAAFDFGQTMNLADPREALNFSDSLQGEVRDDYLLGVLTEQAIKQPAKTAEIATRYFQDDGNLARVYRHLGESWAGKDEHAAAQWLAGLPESAARDQAVSSFSKKLFTMDAERAIQWASSISDEQERVKRVENLLKQWQARDPDAAKTWLERNGHDDPGRQ